MIFVKGDKAEYVIPLNRAFMFPQKKRIRKALNEIKRFVKKHTHSSIISVSNEVNEFLHKNSKNIPRRVRATLYREGGKVGVFLEKGKALEAYIKKKGDEQKKKRRAEKEKPAEKGAEEKAAEKEKTGEEKEKLEQKKEKEKAARAAEIKRKTGR